MSREVEQRMDRRAASDRKVVWGVVAGVVIALLFAVIGLQVSSSNANKAEQVALSLSQQIAAACAADKVDGDIKPLCDRANSIKDQGTTQGDPGPAGPPGPQGPQGPRGYPGTNGTNGTNGTPGPTGAAGKPGAAGADGTPGQNGEDGAAGPAGPPGPSGPPGAVGAQGDTGPKGDTGSAGPAGERGPAGTDGKDGRGVKSIECTNGNETFVITYTDGTSQTVKCQGQGPIPTAP